jgi:hypothetical protein
MRSHAADLCGSDSYPFEKLAYAEGDSWFDKFTPLQKSDTNLLDAVRVPAFVGVVDVAHIGDISGDMVVGHQRRQTEAMFKLFDFDLILFSGGGNDLKNLFAELYSVKASLEGVVAGLASGQAGAKSLGLRAGECTRVPAKPWRNHPSHCLAQVCQLSPHCSTSPAANLHGCWIPP